jgi:hypothetical protein
VKRAGRYTLLTGILLAGCSPKAPAGPAPVACAAGSETFIKDQLFFGRGMPGGGEVSDSAFRDFLAREVTPRFPKGITVHDARGQWQGSSGDIVQERSWVLVLFHPSLPEADQAVTDIAKAYQEEFAQEAVLRERGWSCVAF